MSTTASAPSSRGAILVVYPFCLDHVGHGNIQRILAIARYLVARGWAVDLAYQGNARVPKVEAQYAGFRRVFAVEGGAPSSDEQACATRLAAFYSGHELPPAHMRPSAPLTTLVRSLLDAESYRAVVATYAFTAPMFAGLRRQVLTVCDVQDVMHEHAERCQQATGHASSFTLPAATEAFLWRQWHALIAITPEDEARIARDLLPGQHLSSARHASTCAAAAAPGATDVALYAGSDNQSNVQSVSWLLEQVWPLVIQTRPSARLRVAGLVCAALPEHLRELPGVELLGFQPDISDEIAQCGVMVAPYLYGSGLKIKVVEAACAGKAVVTTTAGAAGTGLEAGRALEVHDAPARFADVLARLLGDRAHRQVLAEAARVDAAGLFSPEVCYEPLAFLIDFVGTPTPPSTVHAVAAGAIDRIRAVVDHVRPVRLVIWGNGSHTRTLLHALAEAGLSGQLIVDGRATTASTSVEGLPVVPAARFGRVLGDLVVLSSETFEPEMWRDLASYRDAGGHVLGLCNSRYVSRGLLGGLSARVRVALDPTTLVSSRTDGAPAVVFWDSGALVSRWWRVRAQHDLAGAATGRGTTPVVVCPAALAFRPDVIAELEQAAQVLPVAELCGHEVEARDVEGGPRGLARAAALLATTSAEALARLQLADRDVLVVIEPSLSECLGLARALAAGCTGRRPAIVLWLRDAISSRLQLAPSEQQAYWRLAVSTLADAAGSRFAVVSPEQSNAACLTEYLHQVVHAVGQPVTAPAPGTRANDPSIVCLGQVSVPQVRPLLEALVAATAESQPLHGVGIVWRSDQEDARPGTGERWASDLASALGIALLDAATPGEVAAAIAGADAVVMLSTSTEGWESAARATAARAGVPVVVPTRAEEAVAAVRDALMLRRRDATGAGVMRHAGANDTLDNLLSALKGNDLPLAPHRSSSPAHRAGMHAFVSETYQ